MKCLLDTHTFLWMIDDPAKLGNRAKALIEDGSNTLYWSAASEWEVAVKLSLGKLDLAEGWREAFVEERRANRILELPISLEHCSPNETLPWHHRDPFDRLLVSQALVEDLVLLTKDKHIKKYPVKTVW